MNFASSAYAQTGTPAAAGAAPVAATAAPGGEHHVFPPFDPASFGPQLFWLAISFGLLYFLMSRLALPRIGSILDDRSARVAGDLAQAGRLKSETDAAVAAYEQALAQARQNAHAIGSEASNSAKAAIAAERSRIESDLQGRLQEAEGRIADVKGRALAEVDAIASDATQAMVQTLLGFNADRAEIARAVSSVAGGRV